MKILVQHLDSGRTVLEEVPAPGAQAGHLLIRTTRSVVSLGTERMLVEFGKGGWIAKARQQPEKLRQVLDKARTDGIRPTLEAVRRKLGQPVPLGYCNAGVVLAVGAGVDGFAVGDRVASNGHHAEVVSVPKNLAAKIPDGVSNEAAAFTPLGAIALQGIRLAAPTFGETVVVIGLGLVGLLTVQLLKWNGCRVIGFDLDERKAALARTFGVEAHTVSAADPVQMVLENTGTLGADAVLITASTQSNDPVTHAARMSRKRGRIVLVGIAGLELSRADFFEKELTFQVSCSYGPGRYDAAYEKAGHDYPAGYVRWTERRNFEAFLRALDAGQVDVTPLITARAPFQEAPQLYANLDSTGAIANLLEYNTPHDVDATVHFSRPQTAKSRGSVGIIGAGAFTAGVLLPALRASDVRIKTIASASGLSAGLLAKKWGAEGATTDYHTLLSDVDIDSIIITTQHNTHAALTIEALQAGKHVFVEKPLALTHEELDAVSAAYMASGKLLHVGYNRRFAPLALKAKSLIAGVQSCNIICTVNAGTIDPKSWVSDKAKSGGRLLGEAGHWIDLCRFLTGSAIEAVCANTMGGDEDNASILLRFANGSTATIHYFTNGSKKYDKERIEMYSAGRTLVLQNWRKLQGWGFKNFSSSSSSQDKGHAAQVAEWMKGICNGGEVLVPFEEITNISRALLCAADSLRERRWVEV